MRDALIAAMQATAARKPTPVEVPAWGTVYVRAVTVAEIEDQSADTTAGDKGRMARGCARVICDADGNRIFDPESAEDVALIAAQPWPLMRQVIAAAEEGANPGN